MIFFFLKFFPKKEYANTFIKGSLFANRLRAYPVTSISKFRI